MRNKLLELELLCEAGLISRECCLIEKLNIFKQLNDDGELSDEKYKLSVGLECYMYSNYKPKPKSEIKPVIIGETDPYLLAIWS